MRLEHASFRQPLEVDVETYEIDTPEGYAAWPDGKDLGPKIAVWKVHGGDFPGTVDVGLVSDPYGFEDTPDSEWISSGVNSKGPRSMALGRQANRFLWGFAGDPTQMTESARRVFVNTVVYMKQFDGQAPLTTKRSSSREWQLVYTGYVETLADDEESKEWLLRLFPESVIAELGLDGEKLAAYYRERLEYLRPGDGGGAFEVDPDLEALSLSNRRPELLEHLRATLHADPSDEVALRLADRYLAEGAPRDAAGILRWIEEHAGALYFSDTAGFRWLVDPRAATAAPKEAGSPGK